MNIKPTILCAALLASSVANATISNGNFENWTNGAPDSWTTVDSGITVSETTNYVENGTSAAQVNVTTKLRQISVKPYRLQVAKLTHSASGFITQKALYKHVYMSTDIKAILTSQA